MVAVYNSLCHDFIAVGFSCQYQTAIPVTAAAAAAVAFRLYASPMLAYDLHADDSLGATGSFQARNMCQAEPCRRQEDCR